MQKYKYNILYVTSVKLDSTAAQSKQVKSMCETFFQLKKDHFRAIVGGNKKLPSYYINVGQNFRLLKCCAWSLFFSLKNSIKEKQKTLVYTRNIAIHVFAILVGITSIYEFHHLPQKKYLKLIFCIFANFSLGKYVSISYSLKKELMSQFKFKTDDILVAHDGVDLTVKINPDFSSEIQKFILKKKDKNVRIILHTGSLYKGGSELFPFLLSNGFEVVHIGGNKHELKILKEKYSKNQINGIHLFETVSRYEARQLQFIADALFYVNPRKSPYYNYTSPLKLFEYMATMVPIICSRGGATDEIVDENCVEFFYETDPSSLNGVMSKLLNSKKSLKKAKNAYTHVSKNFTWHIRVQKIMRFIVK